MRGRAASSRCATSRPSAGIADREKFDYNIVEAFDQYWKARQEGTVGAAWGLLDAQRRDKFELSKWCSAEPNWRTLFILSTLATGLILGGFVVLRLQPRWQGDCDLRGIRPARGDQLRAVDLDRPLPHLLLRAHGRRGVLDGAAGPLQLRPAARHRRQPHRQDGRSLALRRARARSGAGRGASCRAIASCSAPT